MPARLIRRASGLCSTRNGKIGVRALRSTGASRTAAIPPTHSNPKPHKRNPSWPLPVSNSRPASGAPTARVSSRAPTQSRLSEALRTGLIQGKYFQVVITPSKAARGVTKKAARQPSAWVTAPPMTGPRPLATANVIEVTSIQRTRRLGSGNKSAGAANVLAIIMPPPKPCSTLKRISCCIDWERPHSTEPSITIAIDSIIKGLRPYKSPSRPKIRIVTAEARK